MVDPTKYWRPCPNPECGCGDRGLVTWSDFQHGRSKNDVPEQTARVQCKKCGADYRTSVHSNS